MSSRRNLLRRLAAAAAIGSVGVLGQSGTTPRSAGRTTAANQRRLLSLPLVFRSPPLAPFVDPLPVPPQATGDVVVDARATTHRFHRDLPPAPAFGYAGQDYLGPVVEARSGTPTTLTFRNRLSTHVFADDVDVSLHGASDRDRTAPRTVAHLHGGVNPPAMDGHPEHTIMPGQDRAYRYPNRQEAAGLWFHDHAMAITRLNVYAGLASMYLLRDEFDTGTQDNRLGLPAGEFEVPLVLQEKIFTADGRQSARSTPIVPQGSWEGGAVGDVGVVNGAVWPELTVARGLYRFRVLNAANLSTWRLFFSNRMRFWAIGNDGGLLNAPVATRWLKVSPGERIDLLVDFSDLEPGATVVLRNDEPVPPQSALIGSVPLPYLCRFRVARAAGRRRRVPDALRAGPRRLPSVRRPPRVRDMTISQLFAVRNPPALMTLNNLPFQTDDVERPVQGSVEQWNLINTTFDVHPIHLHLVNFRILGRQPFDRLRYELSNPRPAVGVRWTPSAEAFVTGPLEPPAPWEAGLKDTVRVEPDKITRIAVRFPTADELGFDPDATFGGGSHPLRGYVWHCHVLDHEDHDMMLPWRLLAR